MLLILFVLASLTGVAPLARAIPAVVRLVRDSVLFRAPLVAEQMFLVEEAGTLVMHAEAPLASAFMRGNQYAPPPAFRGLEYEMRHAQSGLAVPLHRTFLAGTASGFRKTRVPLRTFALDHPGEYVLSAGNLAPETDTKGCAFVFTRPYGAAMVLHILMIVAGGMLFIGGAVLAGLRLGGAL